MEIASSSPLVPTRQYCLSPSLAKAPSPAVKAAGLVQVNEKGLFDLNYNHGIYYDRKNLNQKQKIFLQQQLDLSRQASIKKYDDGAKFKSHTFTVSAEKCDYYISKMDSLVASLIQEADSDEPTKLVQFNTQLFSYN